MKIDVPFKINLGLYVTRKRDDGYHDLETIFYPVDNVKDSIEMEKNGDQMCFSMEGADFEVNPEKNLCVKAFRILQKEFDLQCVKIHLSKRIPSGAGLGGGSSDAAGVLKLTNELFALGLSNEELKKRAEQLGSDVPFFIDCTPTFATGRGEIMENFPLSLAEKQISVFKPDFSISTAEAYAQIRPQAGRKDLREIIQKDAIFWHNNLVNDFETALFPKYPQLAKIKEKFYEMGADFASLSGSGSAIFAIANEKIKLSPIFAGKDL